MSQRAEVGSRKSEVSWARILVFLFALLPTSYFLLPSRASAAVQVEVGTFVANTGSATTTVTTGFQGKAVILFSDGKTAEGESTGASFAIGLADGTNKGGASWSGDNGVTTTNAGRWFHNTNIFAILTDGGPTVGDYVSAIAFNATPNMVLTWNSTPASAWKTSYILIGGTDITNVKVGNDTIPTTVSSKSFTGVGFQGDAVILIGNKNTAVSTTTKGSSLLGFAIGASKQWGWGGTVQDAAATDANVNGTSKLRNDAVYVGMDPNAGDTNDIADFTSFDADGFTLNFSAVSGSAERFAYLVIKGGSWDCGTAAKPSSATTQTVTGMTFQPKLLGYLLSSPTSLATATSNDIETLGAATNTSARGYAGSYHGDVVTTGTVAISSGASNLLSHELNATANLNFTSFNSDGWTGTWSASGTAFQSAWFAAGDNGGATGTKTLLTGGVTLTGGVMAQ